MADRGASPESLIEGLKNISLPPHSPIRTQYVESALFRFPGSRFPDGIYVPNVFCIEPASARSFEFDDRIGPFGLQIWTSILSYLKPGPLRNMSLVSAEMRELALSELFDTIDLAIPPKANYDPQLRDRQRLFAEEILRKPEYGLLVRRFAWTFGLLPFAKTGSREKKVYAMFQRLTEVKHVYVDVIPGYGLSSIPPNDIITLFPQATHVTLKGEVHEYLASAVLLGRDKPPLKSIILENVEDGYWIANDISARVLPAAISDQRCNNLQYLRLKKECIDFWHHEFDKTDSAIYANWACFIVMAKPRHLSIEHGIHPEAEVTTLETVQRWLDEDGEEGHQKAHPATGSVPSTPLSPKPPPPPSDLEMKGRYMKLKASDMRFATYLGPNLGRGWTGLERLSVRGVSPAAVTLPHGVRCRLEPTPR